MPIVNVRELSRRTSSVIGSVARTGRPAIVTRSGRPIALVTALDPDELEDWVLANAPVSARAMRQAKADLAAGRTMSLESYIARARAGRPRMSRVTARGRKRPGARGG
jgi:prevent-host-death family protein